MQNAIKMPKGMLGFTTVWLGRLISVLTSNMSAFALSIWMFEQTHSAIAMSGMRVSFVLPDHDQMQRVAENA